MRTRSGPRLESNVGAIVGVVGTSVAFAVDYASGGLASGTANRTLAEATVSANR